uniref:7TM GPCR serpentine receptor class x (Srx) domain-containing protein n=1 Tax=Acrobeloides nanus TaxID=290746 RepID=A0A914E3F8_9BILA
MKDIFAFAILLLFVFAVVNLEFGMLASAQQGQRIRHFFKVSGFLCATFAIAIGSTKTNLILSRKAYNIIAMFIFPAGFVIGYVPPYVMTCCKVAYAYQSFSINFDSVVYDTIQDKYVLLDRVTYEYVHRPFFIIATIIPIVCYTYIFGYIFWMKRKMKTINSSIRTEIIRSILFALVFFCYMCSWIYFDLMIVVGIANASLAVNITSMLFIVLEAATNGILQATIIKTVRKAILKTFGTAMTFKKKKTAVVVQQTIQINTTF